MCPNCSGVCNYEWCHEHKSKQRHKEEPALWSGVDASNRGSVEWPCFTERIVTWIVLRDSLYGQYFRGSSPSSWYFGRGLLQRLSTRARKSLAVRAVPQKRLATQELLQNRLISEAVFRQRLTISASYQRETPYKGGDLKRGILQEKLAHSRQHLQSQNHRRP